MNAYARLAMFAAVVVSLYQPGALLLAEVPAASKVTWIRNLYDGIQQAKAEKKPLIVLFTLRGCEWCDKLDRDAIDTKDFQALADRAVFVRAESTDEDNYGNYAQLKKDLKIERFPVAVILDVQPDRIHDAGRILGFFERDEFIGHINKLLKAWQDGQRP